MLIKGEAQQLLVNLGLTYLQAKVYLTLLNSDEATAKTISATGKIDRPDVYRIIDTLVQQGFIEKRIDRPVRFKAFPIDEVVGTLLKRKQEDVVELRNKASEILRQHKNKISKTENRSEYFYILLPFNRAVIDKTAKQIIGRSQTSIDFVCIDIYPGIIDLESLDDFFKRGGRDRILAYNKDVVLAHKVLQSYKKGAIEIRFVSKHSEAPIVALAGDKKEVMIVSTRDNAPEKRQCLFTNSPVIVELTATYFDSLWKRAERFCETDPHANVYGYACA